MKKRKLLFAVLVTAVLSFIFACAANADTEGIFTYYVSNEQVTVTAISPASGDPVTIPDMLGGYPVTALDDRNILSSAYIVENLAIPETVVSIGDVTFSTAKLRYFTVDGNNPNYCSVDGVLMDKAQTTVIKCPPDYMQETFDVPSSVTKIGKFAFSNTHNLKTVQLHEGVLTLCDQAFAFTSAVCNVLLPESLTTIEGNCFGYNSGIKEIVIPKNVTRIGIGAFTDCHNLETAVILADVDAIPMWMFDNNRSLKTVVIPASVTNIESDAFVRTTGLERILFTGSRAQWDAVTVQANNGNFSEAQVFTDYPAEIYLALDIADNNGVLTFSGETALPDTAAADFRPWDVYANEVHTLVLDGAITRIGANDFANWPQLEAVIVFAPDAVLADGAFSGCGALTNVYLFGAQPEGDQPFADCAEMNVFTERELAIHSDSVHTVTVSYADGVLSYADAVSQNAYDFFDALSVFCSRYGRIDLLRVEELQFEGFSVYAVDPETGRQTPIEGALRKGELSANVKNGEENRRISFNELTEGIADGSITTFYLSVKDENHEEESETQFNLVEEFGNMFRKVLRAIVTLLNKLFRIFGAK